jgi:hypothetical protein
MLEPLGPDEVLDPSPRGEQLEVFPGDGGAAAAAAEAAAAELGDDVGVDGADPLEWRQR